MRPGRTIELVEATLSHGGRAGLVLRAWLLDRRDSREVAGSELDPIPPAAEMPECDPSAVWPGGFIASARARRAEVRPGRAAYWVESDVDLLDDNPYTRVTRADRGLFGWRELVATRWRAMRIQSEFIRGFSALAELGPATVALAHAEGLPAHAQSVALRL